MGPFVTRETKRGGSGRCGRCGGLFLTNQVGYCSCGRGKVAVIQPVSWDLRRRKGFSSAYLT